MIRIAAAVVVALLLGACQGQGGNLPNGSSDGRYHTCGYVTEDGVTENLNIYHQRCGD